MKLRFFLTHTFIALALAAVAAGGVLASARGSASGQPEPTMVISPSSGPCDATVEITGQDFPPSTAIRLDVGHPGGEGKLGKLTWLTTDSSGRFAVTVGLGDLGCEAAGLIEELGTGSEQLWIFADLEERPIHGGQGIPPILTRTPYIHTTTQVAPEPWPDTLPRTGDGPDSDPAHAVHIYVLLTLGSMGVLIVAASVHAATRGR